MYSPLVDVVQYCLILSIPVSLVDKFLNPVDKMVFKGPFDELMQDVEGKQDVNVGTGKSLVKGYRAQSVSFLGYAR